MQTITKINEDFLDVLSPDETALDNIKVSEDEMDTARHYRRKLRIHFCCDDDETELDISTIARNSQHKLNWLLQTAQGIVEHSPVLVKTFDARISRLERIQCEHDNDDSDIESLFFFEFYITDNFKSNESVLRFFHTISKIIWSYTETSDAHLDFEEFDAFEGQWCVQPEVEAFSEFCDEDLMTSNTTSIWQYYKFMMRYHLDSKTWKILTSYVSPELYVWDFLEECSKLDGRATFKASNKDSMLEKSIQEMTLCDLSWVLDKDEYEDVIFYNCTASSDAEEEFTVWDQVDRQYIINELHGFKGMKPTQFGYNFYNHTCTLYLYMGCYWIKNVHVHLAISVFIPYEEAERCEKICRAVFGQIPSYFPSSK